MAFYSTFTGIDKHQDLWVRVLTGARRDATALRVLFCDLILRMTATPVGWRAMQCFRSFHTTERKIEGIEAVHMMRKGQVKSLDGSDAVGQTKFIASLFGVAPRRKALHDLLCLKSIFATQPTLRLHP